MSNKNLLLDKKYHNSIFCYDQNEIIYQYDDQVDLFTLPSNIEGLMINSVSFNRPIPNFDLKRLEIFSPFNHPLPICPNLTELYINSPIFEQPISSDSLTSLSIVGTFNQTIQAPNLNELVIISDYFDQPINQLTNLTSLSISGWSNRSFNQSINLPSLTYLSISGSQFNQPIDHLNLSSLYLICPKFNQPLKTVPENSYIDCQLLV